MTITIPIWLIVLVGATLLWWAIGYTFNNTVLVRLRDKWMRKHRTGTVPEWFIPLGCLCCGPVGWFVYLIKGF